MLKAQMVEVKLDTLSAGCSHMSGIWRKKTRGKPYLCIFMERLCRTQDLWLIVKASTIAPCLSFCYKLNWQQKLKMARLLFTWVATNMNSNPAILRGLPITFHFAVLHFLGTRFSSSSAVYLTKKLDQSGGHSCVWNCETDCGSKHQSLCLYMFLWKSTIYIPYSHSPSLLYSFIKF